MLGGIYFSLLVFISDMCNNSNTCFHMSYHLKRIQSVHSITWAKAIRSKILDNKIVCARDRDAPCHSFGGERIVRCNISDQWNLLEQPLCRKDYLSHHWIRTRQSRL